MVEVLPWHAMPVQEVMRAQGVSRDGLSAEEAKRRLLDYGKNELPKPRRVTTVTYLVRQLKSPLVFILAIAAAVSVTLGESIDASLILAILLGNTLLGFYQEYRADHALAALEQKLEYQVTVRREGKLIRLSAIELVPGDIVVLSAGDRITADSRLIVANFLAVNESTLTGESSEVGKQIFPVSNETSITERASMVFAGTTVMAGIGEAVIVTTGSATEFGRVAGMVTNIQAEPTPLQRELYGLSRLIIGIALLSAAFVVILGAWRGIETTSLLAIAAALAVAVVPESLGVALTVILTAGMQRMLRKKALVRRLLAAETLGQVNVVCVDKTGTLTTGEMTVVEVKVRDYVTKSEINHALSLFVRGQGDLASASQTAFQKYLSAESIFTEAQIIAELPFDSVRKFSARAVQEDGGVVWYLMGAPEVVLARCDIDDATRIRLETEIDSLAKRGLRLFLLAKRQHDVPQEFSVKAMVDFTALGIIGLADPLRPEARQTVAQAMNAGIRVVMVTGDHPATAERVARDIGLLTNGERVITGTEMTTLSDAELERLVADIGVYARVLPEQKVRIVKAFQRRGFSVAMTGDGVNDAPALRAAEIGIAVGSGTDVAKETADMVLLESNVQVIIDAIREGRTIYDNIRKVTVYLLTFSLSEVALIAAVLILGFPLPLGPIHILWINLVTDGLPAMALATEPAEPGIMKEYPRPKGSSIIGSELGKWTLFIGGLSVVMLVTLYVAAIELGFSENIARTMVFLALGLDSLVSIYVLRVLRQPLWKVRIFNNPLLSMALLVSGLLLFLPLLIPGLTVTLDLGWPGLTVFAIFLAGLTVKLLLMEFTKLRLLQS